MCGKWFTDGMVLTKQGNEFIRQQIQNKNDYKKWELGLGGWKGRLFLRTAIRFGNA